jgi:hypothetical protein
MNASTCILSNVWKGELTRWEYCDRSSGSGLYVAGDGQLGIAGPS